MNSDRVREWFDRLIDLPPDEQEAELQRMSAEDAEAAQLVRELLGFSTGPDLELERGWNPARGRELGPYRLRRAIGSGGFGEVWRAVRIFTPGAKPVAIKFLNRIDVSDRFRRERELLARLDHPHIARILDGGATPAGVPYLVMEYVTGKPLDVYCERRKLNIAERLRLFDQVLEAVDYAHRHRILHRDLKPGNIFVTPAGDVKLLDFGIAKLMEDGNDFTRTGETPFTITHSSPEQLRGRRLNTAADVYSLGVVLYQLVSGRLPFPRGELSNDQLKQIIAEHDPEPPTQRSSDLNAIVLKSLEKDPERRYPTVESLRNDLQRYRDGYPVEARPHTWWYRLQKTIQRDKPLSAFIAACLLLTLPGIYRTGTANAELTRQRARDQRAINIAGVLASDAIFRLHNSLPRDEVLKTAESFLSSLDKLPPDEIGSIEREIGTGFLRLAERSGSIPAATRAIERSARFPEIRLQALEVRARLYAASGDVERARADEAEILSEKLKKGRL